MTNENDDTRNRTALEWWSDYPCDHVNTVCSFYGHNISVLCQDCNKQMSITLIPGSQEFQIQAESGDIKHNIISVKSIASFLDTSIRLIFIPDPPGDPTGHNPEGDAARFLETTAMLKQNGFDLIKRGIKINSAGTTTTCSDCGHDEHNS